MKPSMMQFLLCLSETEENIEMEELLDDFVTFYIAGILHGKWDILTSSIKIITSSIQVRSRLQAICYHSV